MDIQTITSWLCPVFLACVLTGLSGCSALGPAVFETAIQLSILGFGPDSPDSHRTGKNHYEPVILTSNENVIRIKYLSVGPNAEHEQVTQLMTEYCLGAYIETSRVELRGYDTVEAECIDGSESLQ